MQMCLIVANRDARPDMRFVIQVGSHHTLKPCTDFGGSMNDGVWQGEEEESRGRAVALLRAVMCEHRRQQRRRRVGEDLLLQVRHHVNHYCLFHD